MTISGGSGDDINFYIRNSAGNTVLNPGRVSNTYSYSFTAQKADNYRVYMDNSFSIVSTKTVSYRVTEAYYTEVKYGPRTTYSTLGQQYPWLEWIGIGAVLFPVGMIAFLGARSLENRRRIAAQARAAEQQLAEEREEQRLRNEEEQRRLAMKQNAENLMKAGRYEEAAKYYEQLEMWNEAGECRRLARTTYVVAADVRVGKDGISVNCPHCGSSERLESKASEVTCRHCGRTYYLPKKILDMI
jgi:primosomal protein N'